MGNRKEQKPVSPEARISQTQKQTNKGNIRAIRQLKRRQRGDSQTAPEQSAA